MNANLFLNLCVFINRGLLETEKQTKGMGESKSIIIHEIIRDEYKRRSELTC